MITNIISRGDRPLFNRKYLMALVWLLPIAIVLLSRLAPSDSDQMKFVGPHQLWKHSERNGLTIYLSQGAGLTSNDNARQALLLEGLDLRLTTPDVKQLLEQQHWIVRPQTSSLTTQLQIESKEPIDTSALQNFIALLKQPPAIDWAEPIERITAQSYLAGQNGRQRAVDSMLSSADPEPLAARTYVELIDRPIAVLFEGSEPPEPLTLENDALLNTSLQGKASVAVRGKLPATLLVWRLEPPKSAVEYLAQQTVGILLSDQLAAQPNLRLQVQLSPEGSLVLLEGGVTEEKLATLLAGLQSQEPEIENAIKQLEQRWKQAAKQQPNAWAEVILLFSLEPQSLSSGFEALRDNPVTVEKSLQALQQPADRRARIFTATSKSS